MKPLPLLLALALAGAPAFAQELAEFPWMPEEWRTLERTISYDQMRELLATVDGKGGVEVSIAGTSVGGRELPLVRLARRGQDFGGAPWRILFYAQQHGDEVSGKDALLYLIREAARRREAIPFGVEVWVLPMMNPDGAEAGTRENGAGADLNRDHMTLDQPETRALHAVVTRVHPDVAVDCHEFARDPESWRARGWEKWPDITLDSMNNPLLAPMAIIGASSWVDLVGEALERAGHPFLRYWVGGLPPEEEQRHSAPDIDSAMNALATYGGLSFIAEAAARSGADASAKELGNRVDAYLVLLRHFVDAGGERTTLSRALRDARTGAAMLPDFLPTNYLWANFGPTVTRFPVRELATGRRLEIPTINMMTRIVVKRGIARPEGYAIAPAASEEMGTLLERQGIPFERLEAPRRATVERATLLRVEEEFDEVYARYGGRQIVRAEPPEVAELPPGTLWVPLAGDSAIRAALLLEPTALYGLYSVPRIRALVAGNGLTPVARVLELGARP